jgi:hypothetical protein
MTFTGQFDHFYDKDKHPLLRLSFYNLIPSCTLCNTTLKTSAATTTKPLVHPYFAGFDSVSPAVTFGVTPPFLSAPPTNFEITLEVSPGVDNEDEVRESLHVFQLSEIYQTHKDLVRDLHSKMHLFNADSLKDLKRSLKPSKVNANISKEECFRLYFGTSPDISEYQLRPMSKFNRDIMVNLGFSFD